MFVCKQLMLKRSGALNGLPVAGSVFPHQSVSGLITKPMKTVPAWRGHGQSGQK